MIAQVAQLAADVFSCFDKAHIEEAINCVKDYRNNGKVLPLFTARLLPEVSQGDIIDGVEFPFIDEASGEICVTNNVRAMILSTSCDIDNKETIALCPIFPVEMFRGHIDERAVKNNEFFRFMHFPDTEYQDQLIDFGLISSFPKNLIMNRLKEGRSTRLSSLDQVGYYLFIIKLSILFFRQEDDGTFASRLTDDSSTS